MGGAVLVGVLSMLGVASLPSRSALRLGNRVPLGATPPAAVQAAPVPLQPPAISDAIKTKALSGSDILTGPNVFRGMSATGQLLENPAQLGRADELELVRQALFFIAYTDAQRALATRANPPSGEGGREESLSPLYSHSSDMLLAEMRRAASETAAKSAEARRKGKATATEMPCEVPEHLSDAEFRLTVALGRAAYNKLFHHNQKLVYFEVNKMWPNWSRATVMEKADFLQEGAQGLLRAIRLFDSARGVRFSTYAAWHVRAFVLRALRDKSHIVRLPQTLQTDMMQIRKARYRYAVENQGHAPSNAALAEMLDWQPGRVEGALKGLASAIATSLDAESASPIGSTLGREPMMARVPSTKHDSVAAEDAVYNRQLSASLRKAMAERDPKRSQITRLKFGLEDGVEWTYPQLAARFNLTANVAKGIVRTEVNFLRKSKKRVLQDFVGHT